MDCCKTESYKGRRALPIELNAPLAADRLLCLDDVCAMGVQLSQGNMNVRDLGFARNRAPNIASCGHQRLCFENKPLDLCNVSELLSRPQCPFKLTCFCITLI